MHKYKAILQNEDLLVFDRGHFSSIKECKEWAKDRGHAHLNIFLNNEESIYFEPYRMYFIKNNRFYKFK